MEVEDIEEVHTPKNHEYGAELRAQQLNDMSECFGISPGGKK